MTQNNIFFGLLVTMLVVAALPYSLASNGICSVTMYQYGYAPSIASGVTYTTQYFTYDCSTYGWGWSYCQGSRSVSSTYYYTQYYGVSSYISYQCCAGYTGDPYYACYPVCNNPYCLYGSCTAPNVCTCFGGWRGVSCSEDINECQRNNGGCAQRCTNSPGTYACSCFQGYQLSSDGLHCIDINECSTNNGGCQSMCTNTIGSYYCSCSQGYRLDNDGHHCADINECASSNGGCQQTCHNVIGSYYCSCLEGYLLNSNQLSCDDINECAVGNGGCDQVCTNQIGRYSCSCDAGYKLAYDQHNCIDLPVLTVSALSTSISIMWAINATMEEYEITHTYVGPCPGSIDSGTATVPANLTYYTIIGVYGFSVYNITVAGLKDGIWYQSSQQASTLPAAPVGYPSNVALFELNSTLLTICWSEVQCGLQRSEIVAYMVKYGTLLGNKTAVGTDETCFTARALVPYTGYTFEVAAVNTLGLSGPFSPPLKTETLLGSPTIVKKQTLSPTSVLLTWLPSDGDGLTNYTISYTYEGRCSGIAESYALEMVTSTNCIIEGLEEFSIYTVTVMAARGDEVTESNCTVITPPAAPSAPPTSVVNTSSTSTSITVAWNQVPCIHQNSNISRYTICYGIINMNETATCDDSSVMMYTATGLEPYTEYTFQVAAMNADNSTGPFSEPMNVATLQPFSPKMDIVTPVSIPIDAMNYSVTCKVYIPMEALGTVTMKWFGPTDNLTAINSIVLSNIGGATLNFDLVFSPIYTRDGGWYSCGISYELYPVGSIKKIKLNVESDALFQVKIGPITNCIHLWPLAEYELMFETHNNPQLENIQDALFSAVEDLVKELYGYCEAEVIDWVISCKANSHEVVFKYSLHLSSDHCNCSGTELVLAVEKWVESSGTVEMGRYQLYANSTCQPVRIESLDGHDCLSKKLEN